MDNEQSIRVILADDHQVVRQGIRQFLVAAGIEVVAEAEDGEQAIQFIEQRRPDVVVLDIRMPHKNGIEVARIVRERGLSVGLLVLTAYDDDPFVLAALEAGVNGYVLKTADAEEIVQAVRAVHQGVSVLDPEIVPKLMRTLAATPQATLPDEQITDREQDVLQLAARGLTNKAIGLSLGISDRTVQGHLRKIFEKLGVASRTEAVVRASQMGLVELPPPHETSPD
jgi:DNA-binding NarL/FixJ family response regulator